MPSNRTCWSSTKLLRGCKPGNIETVTLVFEQERRVQNHPAIVDALRAEFFHYVRFRTDARPDLVS